MRLPVKALALSAAALVSIALSEGYRPEAYTPVKGDRPTIGYGTTTGVKPGDKTTPDRALVLLLDDATDAAKAVQRCAPVPMHQYEFDAYASLAYNVGESAFCNSSIPKKLSAGDYVAACKTILDFDKFRDCGKPKVKNPVTGKMECPLIKLPGLTARREKEYRQCTGESQ